jgi:hypothetical protein
MTDDGHFTSLKDGTQVWVGSTMAMVRHNHERIQALHAALDVLRLRVARAQKILATLRGADKTVDAALVALDGL